MSATIVGGYFSSHVPGIGGAIARGDQREAYWKPFFDGYPPVQRWLADARPDVAVVFYNDHGLNFFLDALPTFAVGAAADYPNEDEGWGLPVYKTFAGDPGLSWHIIEELVGSDFDVTMCQRMKVDHALSIPFELAYPDADAWPVKIVPIAINTVQYPLPSPRRCHALGQAVHRALQSWQDDTRVVVVGSGGLRTSSMARGPASSMPTTTASASITWRPTRKPCCATPPRKWPRSPGRRGSRSSTGSRRAVRWAMHRYAK